MGRQLVFENVGETWNSVGGRRGSVLSEAIQSNVARNKTVMCSFRGGPKIQALPSGVRDGNGMAPSLLLKSDKLRVKIERTFTGILVFGVLIIKRKKKTQ